MIMAAAAVRINNSTREEEWAGSFVDVLPRNIYDEVRVRARLGLGLGLANPSPNRNPNPKQWPKWWTMCDSPLNGTLTRNPGAMGPLKPWPRP